MAICFSASFFFQLREGRVIKGEREREGEERREGGREGGREKCKCIS